MVAEIQELSRQEMGGQDCRHPVLKLQCCTQRPCPNSRQIRGNKGVSRGALKLPCLAPVPPLRCKGDGKVLWAALPGFSLGLAKLFEVRKCSVSAGDCEASISVLVR